jgi:predicted RNase H-like nuclease (RuvC/YqgF family)
MYSIENNILYDNSKMIFNARQNNPLEEVTITMNQQSLSELVKDAENFTVEKIVHLEDEVESLKDEVYSLESLRDELEESLYNYKEDVRTELLSFEELIQQIANATDDSKEELIDELKYNITHAIKKLTKE